MQGLFRKRCDDLVNAYVKASLKREYTAQEICVILEKQIRSDRRLFRKRIAVLEREKKNTDRSIEDLAWEIEQLNFRLKSMGVCLTHEVKSRLEAVEARLFEEDNAQTIGCEEAMCLQKNETNILPTDELGWTRI